MSRFSFKNWVTKRNHGTGSRRRPARRPLQLDPLESRQLLAATPIPGLSDEFSDAGTLSQWQRLHQVEGWNADQLAQYDINATQPGRMVQQPHTSVWYQNWRGPMAFQNVTGDFVFTTQVHITDRDDIGGNDADDIPGDAQFSLAGAMIRTPRPITNPAADWAPGSMADDGTSNGENYLFLSLGYGTGANQFSLEAKTTRNSNSQLELTPLGPTANTATVQIARLDHSVIMLYQLPGETWQVHRRYSRPDLPETLQVGLVSYTDWGKAGDFDPFIQNSTVLVPGVSGDPTPGEPFNPDLTAGFEYARYAQPDVPAAYQGLNLADAGQVSDEVLLTFLGAAANLESISDPEPDPEPSAPSTRVGVNVSSIADWDPAWVFKDAFLRARPWVGRAYNIDTGASTWQYSIPDAPQLQVNDSGWVTALASWDSIDGNTYQQHAATVLFTEGANQPTGIYRAEWDGNGTLVMPFVTEIGTTPGGRNYALIDMPANATFPVEIHSTDPENPIRNINVWMPDYNGVSLVGESWTPAAETSPFHPLLIERLDPFDTIRFMNFQQTNDTDEATWADRRPYVHATQADGDLLEYFHTNGVSLEYMIELANELDANPWFNMPHQADDAFVTNFATLVRDHLDDDLTVYVEWSNELWNAAFPTYSWIQEQMTLPENAGLDFFQVAGQEIQRDFDIWSSVFAGQDDRLVRVVAGQQANSWLTEQLVLNVDGRLDAISATAYAGISYDMSAGYNGTTTADDIIDDLFDISIPWASARLQEHRALVEQYEAVLGRDLQFVVYEGGSHVIGYPNAFQAVGAEAAALEAMHSPRMYDVYQTLLNEVQAAEVDLYTEFTFTSRAVASYYGSYGLLQDMTTPLNEAHQLRALLDFAGQPASETTLVTIELQILDDQGNPVSELEVGQSFVLQAVVDDSRPDGQGVFSAFLDVTYDSSLAAVTGDLQFGSAYENAREGNLATAGLIDEVGGIASTVPLGDAPRVLFSVPLVATAVGDLVFAGDTADLLPAHEVTIFGGEIPVAAEQIEFLSASLTIVPAVPPAVAIDDTFTAFNDATPIVLDVLANDTGDAAVLDQLSIVAVTTPTAGTIAINGAADRILFTPPAGVYGDVSFSYTLRDEHGQEASAEVVVELHKRWQNPAEPTDANNDQQTSPMDALVVINALIRFGSVPLSDVPPSQMAGLKYIDVNGDGLLTPADALIVINKLINQALQRGNAWGEGEYAPLAATNQLATASSTTFAATEMVECKTVPTWVLPVAPRVFLTHQQLVDDLFAEDDAEDWLTSGRP